MLERTDHEAGRWYVIAGDDKRHARVAVIERVCEVVEHALVERYYAGEAPSRTDSGLR